MNVYLHHFDMSVHGKWKKVQLTTSRGGIDTSREVRKPEKHEWFLVYRKEAVMSVLRQ